MIFNLDEIRPVVKQYNAENAAEFNRLITKSGVVGMVVSIIIGGQRHLLQWNHDEKMFELIIS